VSYAHKKYNYYLHYKIKDTVFYLGFWICAKVEKEDAKIYICTNYYAVITGGAKYLPIMTA